MSLIRSKIRLLGALLALLLVAAACGGDDEVAGVADSSLSQDDLEALVEEPEPEPDVPVDEDGVPLVDGDAATVGDAGLTGEALGEFVGTPDGTITKLDAAEKITTWVRNELWYSAMAAEGVEPTQAHLDAARAELQTIALTNPNVPDLDGAFGDEVIRSQALPAVVAEFLVDVRGVVPAFPLTLCSSHILLETEEEAVAAIARLDQGEEFAALAMELSTGPSGPGGGDLGCVDPSSFVPEFSAGAAAVDPPGVSEPIETQFGWHVIEVRSLDSTPSDDPAVVQEAVFSGPEFAEFQQEVLEAEVTIDPAYGTWDPQGVQVVPA